MIIGNFGGTTDDRDVKDFYILYRNQTKNLVSICEKEKNINNLKILLANEATKNSSWQSSI